MFAYDVEMQKTIAPGDSIEILQTPPDAEGKQELLYVALHLGDTTRELFRFRTDEGTVDFYDPAGETGKRFLTRRPLQGGGRLASRFGMPHPPHLQDPQDAHRRRSRRAQGHADLCLGRRRHREGPDRSPATASTS